MTSAENRNLHEGVEADEPNKLAIRVILLYIIKYLALSTRTFRFTNSMYLLTRLTVAAVCAVLVIPSLAHAQDPAAPPKDTATKKPDSAATAAAVDKSLLTGFYEIEAGRGLTITLEKDTLYGAPPNGQKRKLIYQSGLAFAVDGTKMTLTFVPGPDGVATDLVMQGNGQTRMLKKIR